MIVMNQETIVEKHYAFLKELIATINRFPKHQRFLIGDKMNSIGMTILDLLVEAFYAPTTEKRLRLQKVNTELEKLRFYCRLCYELGFYTSIKYNHLISMIQEIGKMTGGWLRSLK
jgi:four helix bundle protein